MLCRRIPSARLRASRAAFCSFARCSSEGLDAVRDGIAEEMRRDPNFIYFGEGTGERGGSFAHTKNLWQEFGPDRMVDTPISEQGFTAAAVGASSASDNMCDSGLMRKPSGVRS